MDYQANIDFTTGEITSIDINSSNPVGENLLGARIDIYDRDENGSGAVFEAVIEDDPTDPHFGKITALTMIEPGINYKESSLLLKVVPIIRAINEGVPAEAVLSAQMEFNATTGINEIKSSTILLKQNIDGSLKTGSGYVISPRLYTPPFESLMFGGKSYARLPLSEPIANTSSVEPFELGPLSIALDDAVILGGFAQSPVFIDVNIVQGVESIEYVSLVVDGKTDALLTKNLPSNYDPETKTATYSFAWTPDEPKDYSITAIVRDVAGNISTTPESLISMENYQGGGVSLTAYGDSNYSVEANGQLLLSLLKRLPSTALPMWSSLSTTNQSAQPTILAVQIFS